MRLFIQRGQTAGDKFGTRCVVLMLPAVLAACATPAPPARVNPPVATPIPVVIQAPAPVPVAAPVQVVIPAPAPVAPPPSTVVEAAPAPEMPPVSVDKITLLQTWVNQQERLYRVAAPLLIQNTELCPRHVRNLLGMTAKTKYSYTADFVAEAQTALGLDERLRIMDILPASGAALAGMQKGDILLKVEIEPFPQGPDAERAAASLIGAEIQGRSSLNLTVLRDGERVAVTVPLTPACAMTISLGNSGYVNSYADGHRVMVTRAMLDFVQSDQELAYVLAKEIAHNALSSSARQDMSALIGRLDSLNANVGGDNPAAGIAPYSQEADASADKLALYMLVRAGYSIDAVLDFWKRLALAYPKNIKNFHTALHPSTDYRLTVMAEVMKTIETKQKGGLPLLP